MRELIELVAKDMYNIQHGPGHAKLGEDLCRVLASAAIATIEKSGFAIVKDQWTEKASWTEDGEGGFTVTSGAPRISA